MEDESIIKVEIHDKIKRFEFFKNNCINLSEVIELIKKEFNFKDKDDIQIYHIDDEQNIIKQILNNEDLQSSKKKISKYEYLIKLKINIEPESQKNKDMILSQSNIISQSRIENEDKNAPAPFPLKSSIFVEKNEEFPRVLKENKKMDNDLYNKVFEEKLKLLESNHIKEFQSLNKEINKMSKKINIVMTFILNVLKSKKNSYKKLEEDMANKIKNIFNDYDKNMNSKINEIKNKLNDQANNYINEQIKNLISKAKNSNDNKVCSESQINIIKNNDNNIVKKKKKNSKKLLIKNKKDVVMLEKKNEKLEDNNKSEKDENLFHDKINMIEVENNSNNHTSNNLKNESPKRCQKDIENINDNNKKNYIIKSKSNTNQMRYNIIIKNDSLDRIKEDKNEINNNESLKEQKRDFQDNSLNIINYNKTNKNIYYAGQNSQRTNFNCRIKKICDDSSNLLNLTVPNIEIAKKRPQKVYLNINKIFFIDFQQKNVKFEKINDFELEQLGKEIEKEFNEGKIVLKNFYQNFIEVNVLPIFKKSKLDSAQFEALEYNIEKILEICGLPKNYYSNDIHQQNIKKIIDRKKSIEALKKFRKEFGISEKEMSDEGIIKRLEENGLDINKTFQKMFG